MLVCVQGFQSDQATGLLNDRLGPGPVTLHRFLPGLAIAGDQARHLDAQIRRGDTRRCRPVGTDSAWMSRTGRKGLALRPEPQPALGIDSSRVTAAATIAWTSSPRRSRASCTTASLFGSTFGSGICAESGRAESAGSLYPRPSPREGRSWRDRRRRPPPPVWTRPA